MRLPALRVRPSTLAFVVVAILATAPAWVVRHPPLEDLPFHVATLRVVHSYSDPAFGFKDDFFLNLTHTQYALYYIVGSLLAYLMGVKAASVGLMCLYLGGTVLALRALLEALGKDQRLCLFVIPLLVNPIFMYGLLPFMCGMPLMFLGLAVTVRYVEKPTRGRGIGLGVLAFALFFAHVVPYAIFGIAFAALFPWTRPSKWLAVALPVVPSLGAVAWWILGSSQGTESAGALSSAFHPPPILEAIARFPQWSIDVFTDSTDERHAIALAIVALVAMGLAQGDRDRTKTAARALVVIPVVCLVMYFSTGSMLGDVWLFSERFPVPLLMSLVPLMRMPSGFRGYLVTALAGAVALSATVNVCKHFIEFEIREVGDFDDALAAMQPRKHVAGLIYDKMSGVVNDVAFLHFVSYYQAEKGGVVQFSNSGALYWPVRWKEGHYPPPGTRPRLRWEWTPEQVPLQELYPYYDYVLVRGYGFNPPASAFRQVFRGSKWSVYQRVGG